ncbi:MAG: ADP-forming succinate--CoA ligase subunit beta [Candidatus Njordarchaeales archaeon]
MFLYEHEGKMLFHQNGISIPKGRVVYSPNEAINAAKEIGFPVVLKPQILGGKRGKAGAIRFANDEEETLKIARELFNMELYGEKIERLLVEKKVDIAHEYYLSLTVDFYSRKPILIFSTEGGISIEEVAKEKPHLIEKRYLDPDIGLTPFIAIGVLNKLGISGESAKKFVKIFTNLWKLFEGNDLFLAEINPLVLTKQGDVIALDARVVVDDNAQIRRAWIGELKSKRTGKESLEIQAKKLGISFVILEGNIGVIGNGAGLTMATCDTILELGGKPANFLDIGGGAGPERVASAIDLIMKLGNIKVILINIFGGITRADNVAKGIISAMQTLNLKIPIVVRLRGTNEEIGREMLQSLGINAYTDMIEAVKKAIEIAKGGNEK